MLHFFYNNFTNIEEEKHNRHVSHRYRKTTSKMLHFFYNVSFIILQKFYKFRRRKTKYQIATESYYKAIHYENNTLRFFMI